ncbi:uncharacterized protein LOC121050060 [Rosa chinensis]|uniref:uncharacterized protein LOC121050060 n=1 Tax=Rosa chinensis TaxID=74649 RepID=UPI001AD8ACB4|nr:uncharacterized protein LOC121050060 [Rosa chinensis]
MDKSWIDVQQTDWHRYEDGVDRFLDFAFANSIDKTRIYCPCKLCRNRYFKTREEASEDIKVDGFWEKYRIWDKHGESRPATAYQGTGVNSNVAINDDMFGMINEAIGAPTANSGLGDDCPIESENVEGPNDESAKFLKLLQDAECPLYPVLSGWTNKSFDLLLELLKSSYPDGVSLPDSFYKAQKLTADLGFTYKTWDACPNNCMLFRNEDEKLKKCAICGESRYKELGDDSNDQQSMGKKVPAKQVRYFPLKPRLQRLFMSSKTASYMKWHAEDRTKDDVLRHPADSLVWKTLDEKFPDFSSDSRNVRLGLAADGFNPFRTMSIAHSTWPVVLIPYNLPPWMCMKQPFFILSTLIDGPKGPGNKIDVFLQPLIEELKELWHEGVLTYDASTNQMFNLRAMLLWTINDFPAYANLSSWSTKGAKACPCCNKNTKSSWLKHGRKYCYMCHRRFLPRNHKFRKDKVSFDGKQEWDRAPNRCSGTEVKRQLQNVLTEYKKKDLRKRKREELEKNTAARRALPKNVVEALIELANFFRQLCSKVNKPSDLKDIQERIALTLCHLEKMFPMSFFDIMEHLPIHLAEEALIAGPVQFRWMYPIERFLFTLKEYVRNRAHPEASIAKGYLMEECMTFCSRYLDEVETKSNRPDRNYDGGTNFGRRLGKGVKIHLDDVSRAQAHKYVLMNTDAVTPFRNQHLQLLVDQWPNRNNHYIQKLHGGTFHKWFKNYVMTERRIHNRVFSDEIIALARGPHEDGLRFKGYFINGFRFRTKSRDKKKSTQNSGIMMDATTGDNNRQPIEERFYGVLTDVIQIRYTNHLKFVLFKGDWINNRMGLKKDEFKFTLVNFNHLLYKDNVIEDEPFILTEQARQVCYVQDPSDPNWHVVLHMTVRDLFDMYSKDSSRRPTVVPQVELYARQQLDETIYQNDEEVNWVREGVDGTEVDTSDNDVEVEMEE